jgi:hypothetical protein
MGAGGERALDRTRFSHLALTDLAAERDALREELEGQRRSVQARSDARTQLERTLEQAKGDLARKIREIGERAVGGEIDARDLTGVGDLWTIAHDGRLVEALRAAVGDETRAREASGGLAAEERLLREIAEREAELALRVAEVELRRSGEELDPVLAERLAEQVLLRSLEGDNLDDAEPRSRNEGQTR